MNEKAIESAGLKPALKHIKVFSKTHEQIQRTTKELREIFTFEAQKTGLLISNKGKGRDMIPGQPEAVEYLLFKGAINGDFKTEYVRELIQRAKGVQ